MSVGNLPFRDPRIEAVLNRLHRQAAADKWKIARRVPLLAWAAARKKLQDKSFEYNFFHDLYIPVSREQGAMLYLIARAINARRIVEFGSSFGISAIYLAAAARDNGGELIGSEMEPSKHAQATKNIEDAGLSGYAKILPGDARETFSSIAGPVDLVLLDGWKAMYIPVIEILKPKLRSGAIVLAFRRLHAIGREWVRLHNAANLGWVRVFRFRRKQAIFCAFSCRSLIIGGDAGSHAGRICESGRARRGKR
jgi:predicted O-methyltransferase YrrM